MKIIVTGSAGFIGSSLCIKLLERGDSVIGIDNHNDYYDPRIKEARLARLTKFSNYQHYKMDICNQKSLDEVFKNHNPKKSS
jgi:UDP-glucuronate 4-epimerase